MKQFFLRVLPVLYSQRRWKENIKRGQGEFFRNPGLLHRLQYFPSVLTYSFPQKHQNLETPILQSAYSWTQLHKKFKKHATYRYYYIWGNFINAVY